MNTRELVSNIYVEALHASRILREVVHKTPLDFSRTFSKLTGGKVYMKLENLQRTGAFKVRGAYYKIYKLPEEQKKKGVVAASAGNHAQGVAFAATAAGIPSTIVMPETAPISKIQATQGYGAKVVLYGTVYDDAYRKALEIAEETGAVFIHPFDDPDIIAGQGSIAVEILEELQDIDIVVVQIGGGGLISGIASVIRNTLGDDVKIIGVEPASAPKMKASIEAGRIVEIQAKPSIADGLVTKKPGKLTFQLVSELVDDIVTVTDDEIAHAILMLLERSKTVAEGAGAAGLAAVLSGKIDVKGKKAATIISGGNIDVTLLSRIVMRELVRQKRIVIMRTKLPDRPGTLRTLLEYLAEARLNIIEISHDRYDPRLEPGWAEVTIIAEVPQIERLERLVRRLEEIGYEVELEY